MDAWRASSARPLGNDALGVGAVADQNLRQFRRAMLAGPWILAADVVNAGAKFFFGVVLGQDAMPFDADDQGDGDRRVVNQDSNSNGTRLRWLSRLHP